MHHNFIFDLDQTLLDFHASEYKALRIVLEANGLPFSDEIYTVFKAFNKSHLIWNKTKIPQCIQPDFASYGRMLHGYM